MLCIVKSFTVKKEGGYMKFVVDERVGSVLGVDAIVGAILTDVDIDAPLSESMEDEIKEVTEMALNISEETIADNEILEGYREKTRQIGRSLKRYPPSAEALINNMKRRGEMPRIKSLIDIYNVGSLKSMLSIGAHDLDAFEGPLRFTFADEKDSFTPVGGGSKPVHEGDFVYRDDKGIAAYLDARDADDYKIVDDTKNVLLIIQGNSKTSAEMRENMLKEICDNIKEICGGEFRIFSVKPGEEKEV